MAANENESGGGKGFTTELRAAASRLRVLRGEGLQLAEAWAHFYARQIDRAAQDIDDLKSDLRDYMTACNEEAARGERLLQALREAAVALAHATHVDGFYRGAYDAACEAIKRLSKSSEPGGEQPPKAAPAGQAESGPAPMYTLGDRFAPSYGRIIEADFEANTVLIQLEPGYTIRAGLYALMPQRTRPA